MTTEAVPDLLAALLPYFERVTPQEQPLLLAVLERYAAEHYRRWAQRQADPARRQAFLDCAAREEFIAETAESTFPDAEARAHALRRRFPEIPGLYAEAMRQVTDATQWRAQANGEMGGASLYQRFAEEAKDPAVRAKFLLCAEKEAVSARFLESLL